MSHDTCSFKFRSFTKCGIYLLSAIRNHLHVCSGGSKVKILSGLKIICPSFLDSNILERTKNFGLFTKGISANTWWVILKEFVECYLDNLSRYVEQGLQQSLGRYNEHVHNIRRVFGRLSHLYLLNSECSRNHLGLSVHPPLSAWTMYIDLLSAEKLFMRVFDSCETNILSMVRNHSRTFKSGQNKTRNTWPNCQKEECEC